MKMKHLHQRATCLQKLQCSLSSIKNQPALAFFVYFASEDMWEPINLQDLNDLVSFLSQQNLNYMYIYIYQGSGNSLWSFDR